MASRTRVQLRRNRQVVNGDALVSGKPLKNEEFTRLTIFTKDKRKKEGGLFLLSLRDFFLVRCVSAFRDGEFGELGELLQSL